MNTLLRILASATQDRSREGAGITSQAIIATVFIMIGRQQIVMSNDNLLTSGHSTMLHLCWQHNNPSRWMTKCSRSGRYVDSTLWARCHSSWWTWRCKCQRSHPIHWQQNALRALPGWEKLKCWRDACLPAVPTHWIVHLLYHVCHIQKRSGISFWLHFRAGSLHINSHGKWVPHHSCIIASMHRSRNVHISPRHAVSD